MQRGKGFFFGCLFLTLLLNLAVFGQLPAQEQCDKELRAAEQKFKDGYLDEVLALVNRCLEKNTLTAAERVRSFELLAKAYEAMGLLDDARENLRKLLALNLDWRPDEENDKPSFQKLAEEIVKEIEQKRQAQSSTETGPSAVTAKGQIGQTKARQDSGRVESNPQSKKPINPLLIFPQTNVLDWLVVNWGGGSNFGVEVEKEEKNPWLAHLRVGFDIAELEFRTVEIINRPLGGRAELPTLAFKLKIVSEGTLVSNMPALTAVVRTSVALRKWNADIRSDWEYRRRLRSLLLFFSKSLGAIQLHAGMSRSILTARVLDANDVPMDSLTNRRSTFFVGWQWRLQSLAMLMVELEPIAKYTFVGNRTGEADRRYLVRVGVRAFPLRSLAVDVGGVWFSDLRNDNYRINLGATIGLSLPKVFRELRRPKND